MPSSVLSFCETYGAKSLFGNIEYEVDELRRDIELCRLAAPKGVQANFFHNKCVVEPGVIVTKQKKSYAVSENVCLNFLSGNLIDIRFIHLTKSSGSPPSTQTFPTTWRTVRLPSPIKNLSGLLICLVPFSMSRCQIWLRGSNSTTRIVPL